MRAIEYPFFWLDPNAQMDPDARYLGVESAAESDAEGEIDMAATVVALRGLGYKVPVKAVGALVSTGSVACGRGPPGWQRDQQARRLAGRHLPRPRTTSRGHI